MRRHLLDANLLIALAKPVHTHHSLVQAWFEQTGRFCFATCPIVQSGFLRLATNPKMYQPAHSFEQASDFLTTLGRMPGHKFWPDTVDWSASGQFLSQRVQGHRQITDLYLLSLAEANGGTVATLDRGFVTLTTSPELVMLIRPV